MNQKMNRQNYRYPTYQLVQTGSNQNYSPSIHHRPLHQSHPQSVSPLVSINHQGLRKDHLLIKFIPTKNQLYSNLGRISEELIRINKNYKIDLSPLKHERNIIKHRESLHVNKAVQLLSPRTNISVTKDEESTFNTLKERISKFIKQGSKIAYKYKKSIASVEKRKRESEKAYTERAQIVRSEAKTQLHSILKRPSKKNWEETYQSKLFYFDKASSPKQAGQNDENIKNEEKIILQKKSIEQVSKSAIQRRIKTQSEYDRSKQIFAKHKQLVNKKLLNEHLNKLNKSRIQNHKIYQKIAQNTTKIRFREHERKADIKVTKLSPLPK